MKYASLLKVVKINPISQLILILSFLLPGSAVAQTLYLYPTTVTAPRGSYQTVTAVVTGVANKTVTWSSDGGTIIGTNPCVVNEPCTAALYTTTAGTYHLTATSNADGSVVATSTITITASPTPVTTHPRLLVTAAMLPGLQAKATSGNTMYQAIRSNAISAYNSDNAVWSWSCNGGTGLPSSNEANNWEQQNAYLYAFMSMIDPSDSTYKWGCYGRDVWTYVMASAMNGQTSLVSNEWSDSSPYFAFTTDFLMAGGYLSTTDQTQARAFLAYMVKLVMNDSVGDTWSPTATVNSQSIFHTGNVWDLTGMRAMGNNYTESKLLYLVAAGLTFNDTTTDDPAMTNTCNASRYQVCSDYSAGSLHAYWQYFVGTALYEEYAHLEDPTVSWPAYQAAYGNLPTQPTCYNTDLKYDPCFGDGRGGEASEGSWYDYALYRLRYAMNAIHTAGYDDPTLYGPQMSLENTSWWDLKYVADLEFLTGFAPSNGPASTSNATPAYSFLTTGDSNTYYRMVSDMWTESATLVADTYTGRTDRTNALKWGVMNMAFGGPLGNVDGCSQYCGFTEEMTNPYGASVDEDMFIALPAGDPTTSLPTDPRPSFPTDLYNGSNNQHIMARSSFAATGTLFSYYCPNTFIDHEHQFCGRFDIFANGEYITKGRTEFTDYNDTMNSAPQQNIAAIQNTVGTSCTQSNGCYWWPSFTYGGQMWDAYQAGFNTIQHEEMPTYVAAVVNSTNDYNGSANQYGDYNDVKAASRSLVYLRGTNQVVFYDRATTGHAGTKAVYQNTTGAVSISGSTATWNTRSGKQTVSFTSMLPAGATLSNVGLTSSTYAQQATDWEPYTTIEVNAGSPLSTQFLSVMQWGESSFSPDSSTTVESTSGQNFDGVLIGSTVVMFMRSWPATLTGVTYPASGGTTQYVSDLTPNTTYTITGTGTPTVATADAAGVLTFSASGTGNITISSGGTVALSSIAVTPASATVAVGGTQQYSATCNYSDSSIANCSSSVTWTTSSATVATISSTGLATGVAAGGANLVATSGSVQGEAAITVATGQAATPTFSPAGGAYTTAQAVTISTTTTGATIYYTTNGSTPTTSSSVYSGPVSISSSETLNAIAVLSGDQNSATGSATYTINLATAATPAFSPAGGTYTAAQTVTISSSTASSTIYYTTNGTTPTTSSTVYSGPITVSSSETLEAIAVASGYSTSAAGSAIYTINLAATATPTFSPAGGTYTAAQTVTISSSTASSTIYYTTNGATPTTSSTVYSGPITVSSSETVEAIAVASAHSASAAGSAAYTINLAASATPVFSPAAGTYTAAQTVTISTTTSPATIYYTTNGTAPTTSSAVYSGPITVSGSETVEAIAVGTGLSASAPGVAAYTINATQSGALVFTPAPGTYTTAQTVSITAPSPSAVIHYTTNGTQPTSSSPTYTAPIAVSSTETINAMAVTGSSAASISGSASYTIVSTPVVPIFSPAPGTYHTAQTLTIADATAGTTIYYTTNGTTPTTSSTVYTGAIKVNATETVKAIAVLAGAVNSAVESETYTFVAAMPTFSLPAGTYSRDESVRITDATPGVTIYYTTNGTTPTTASAKYTAAIPVSQTKTIQAIAMISGYTSSQTAEARYTLNTPVVRVWPAQARVSDEEK